jgi:hypothetical protein
MVNESTCFEENFTSHELRTGAGRAGQRQRGIIGEGAAHPAPSARRARLSARPTHLRPDLCAGLRVACSPVRIEGSAMLTMETSSNTMNPPSRHTA